MDELTPAELDLLVRIDTRQELRPFFFREAKGLKWFDALDEKGYFDPAGNVAPVLNKEEDYVTVPFWLVTEYLVATSPELLAEENFTYAERVLGVIRAVTQAAIEQDFSNYRTWWQFSKIIQNIPVGLITLDDFTYIDFWLDDKYNRGWVAKELGENWLGSLLKQQNDEAEPISLRLLQLLYKVSISAKEIGDSKRQEAAFRFSSQRAEEITKTTADKSGQVLGQHAVKIFKDELQRVLKGLGKDEYSSLWRPAIEEHTQNRSAADVEGVLVVALRESLGAYVREASVEAIPVVAELLESPFHIFKRIAIFLIGQNYQQLVGLVEKVVADDYFMTDLRHEMWHLLDDCYPLFSTSAKQRVQEIIAQMVKKDEDDNLSPQSTAYRQAVWLAAIKNHGELLDKQYRECVARAGAEPDHPDFASYWFSGFGRA